jgi:hypothetical protein
MLYFDSRCHATDKLLDHHSSTPRELRKKSRSAPPRAWFQIRTTWSTSRDAATTLSLPSLRSSLRRFTLAAILLLRARASGVCSCRVGSQAGLTGVCFVPCVDQDPVRSRKSAIVHRKRTEPPPIKIHSARKASPSLCLPQSYDPKTRYLPPSIFQSTQAKLTSASDPHTPPHPSP